MATITLEIPDVKGLNMSAMKDELGKYAQSLVVVLCDKLNSSQTNEAKLKALRSLYSTFEKPSEKSYEELREEVLKEKYGI